MGWGGGNFSLCPKIRKHKSISTSPLFPSKIMGNSIYVQNGDPKAWGGLQIVQHVVKDIQQNFRGLISLNPISLTIGNLNTKWKIWVKQKIHLIGIFFFLNIFLETWKFLPFIIFLLFQQNTLCCWLGFLSSSMPAHCMDGSKRS